MSAGNVAQNMRASDYERAKDDWYVEPRWCVEQLIDAMPLLPDSYVWDPCCGGGTIPSVFAEKIGAHRVIATDIVNRGAPGFDGIWDATGPACPFEVQPLMRINVVTNPPYKIAEAVIRRMLVLADHRVAALVSLQFLASRGRRAFFAEFPPSDVLVLSQRPSMPPGASIADLGDRAFKGGTTDFCWIVWTKPHDRETRTRWLPVEAANG